MEKGKERKKSLRNQCAVLHTFSSARMQSHSGSIHSPHKIRNIIMNEWKKSLKFHLNYAKRRKRKPINRIKIMKGEKSQILQRKFMCNYKSDGTILINRCQNCLHLYLAPKRFLNFNIMKNMQEKNVTLLALSSLFEKRFPKWFWVEIRFNFP